MRRSIHPRPSSKGAIWAAVIPLLLVGCREHEQPRSPAGTASAPQRPAPAEARAEAVDTAPVPVVVDPYDTPYAVVPARSEHDPCLLPASPRPQWAPVWTLSSRLDGFAESRHELTALRAPKPGVGGFCAYKWTDARSLPKRQDFQAIGAVPDRPLLTASAAAASSIPQLPGTVSEPLLKLFQKQAGGAPRAMTRQVLAGHAARAKAATPVKVAVIDATPTKKGLTTPDRTYHGFSVSRTVAQLACDDPDSPACAEQVVAQLALPIVGATEGDTTEDFESGGRTGSFTHLYDAIERALEAWKPKEQHLVINFSVGWDPVKADPGDENVERIKAQLERASCMGALIVAAAGNYSGSTGPVFPAAFEALKAPTGDACTKFKLEGIAPAARPARPARAAKGKTPPYAPLVHSVGAVDALDQRLLVNRRWGQPRLAALGVSVMVPGPPGTPYTPPHDGTSMSAAIVSGIAAAVWAARPELDAAGVMQAIYDGGVKLDPGQPSHHAQTEYCEGEAYGPCHQWPVHRANLCGALAKALPGEKLACDTSPPGAAELPSWPAEAKAAVGKPKQPCRLTECGVPQGPMANQLAAGPVGQGSYGNCNSCTFQVLNTGGTMTLAGTPTVDPPTLNMDWYTATLNTDQNQSYPLSLTFGTSMTGTQLTSVLANTSQASITWVIKIHNVAHTVTNVSTLTRVPPY